MSLAQILGVRDGGDRRTSILPEVIADLPVGLYADQISRAGQSNGTYPRRWPTLR
jgi:hypothetical protein